MRALRALSGFAATLLLIGCFEEAVDERLTLAWRADGQVEATLVIEIRRPASGSPAALVRRLDELEEALLGGYDEWSSRFDDVRPLAETYSWSKSDGRLERLERRILLPSTESLNDFLADTGIYVTYELADGFGEAALYPGTSTRASRSERRRVASTLGRWSETIAGYFAAAEPLYRYLERAPERAPAVFAHLFDDDSEEVGDLVGEEEALVEALSDRMSEALSILDSEGDAGRSLDELSRRVYDPFPARLEVRVPGEPIEVEGLVPAADGHAVPGLSLWAALEQIADRWLEPDPLVSFVDHLRRHEDEPFAADFAARPRRVELAPTARGTLAALEEWLSPRDVYRIRWRSAEPAGEDSKG